MEMNLTHSSKTVIGVLLVTVLLVSGTAAAVSFDEQPPEPAQVGDTVEAEVTMTDVFEDPLPNSYTLQANTQLNDADFTIRGTDVAGDTVVQEDVASSTATLELSSEQGISEVTIIVEGQVPEMSEFNYQDRSVENYTAVELSRAVDNGTSTLDGGVFRAHRFTEQSQQARQAIDAANESVQQTGGGGDGEDDLNLAVAAYNRGNFQNAIDLAENAESTAEGSQQTTQLLLIGGSVVALVAVVGGGAYVYRQRQQDTSKLR